MDVSAVVSFTDGVNLQRNEASGGEIVDKATLLREADLQHHLSVEEDKSVPGAPKKAKKPADAIIAGPATGQSATAPAL